MKNHFIFDSVQKRDLLKFYRLSGATFYDRINSIYQFIKPFLDIKCLFLRNMEPYVELRLYSTVVIYFVSCQ